MRLGEALRLSARNDGVRDVEIHLLCGFSPLHFETFVCAHAVQRLVDARVRMRTGLYGDLIGNVTRARESAAAGAIVVFELSDLDARLGFRTAVGWRREVIDDIPGQVEQACVRLETVLLKLASAMPVVVAGPTIGPSPLQIVPPGRAGALELAVNLHVAAMLQRLGAVDGISVASQNALMSCSPASRYDARMDLHAGFPYTLVHADALAATCVEILFPAIPRKGLITDLDQTLWRGILGEIGVENVSWSVESKSQIHGLYQQLLSSLADAGVLLAIASKNDPELVAQALGRADLLVAPAQYFPIEAGWNAKSQSIGKILDIWNIAADSVVFVDDSPMELAEVGREHPGIECLQFPADDPSAAIDLLWRLRALFGKSHVFEEDRLRLNGIKALASQPRHAGVDDHGEFLANLDATVTIDVTDIDERAFELVNKTNQFNLNGRRFIRSDWHALSMRPNGFIATVSYRDRFGPLGRIGVIAGTIEAQVCHVDVWVMSCRAFSRGIEFQTLRQLFQATRADRVHLTFEPTERNGPFRSFIASFVDDRLVDPGRLTVGAAEFEQACPVLFHKLEVKWTTPLPG